jgi:hypothetical protein
MLIPIIHNLALSASDPGSARPGSSQLPTLPSERS